MSIDFNSIINKAVNEAHRNRVAASGNFDKSYGEETIKGTAFVGSEISEGDIANAIKAKNVENKVDNDFVSLHSTGLQERKEKKASNEVEAPSAINRISQDFQSTVNKIHNSSEKALDRQGEVARSLKSYQNPFVV